MLLVPTSVRASANHGLGLFAETRIEKDTTIWRFDAGFDQVFTAEQLERLPPVMRRQLWQYAYRDVSSGLYVLCADNARFFNHSSEPNTYDRPNGAYGETVARVTIEAGQEITNDYFVDDGDAREKLTS